MGVACSIPQPVGVTLYLLNNATRSHVYILHVSRATTPTVAVAADTLDTLTFDGGIQCR